MDNEISEKNVIGSFVGIIRHRIEPVAVLCGMKSQPTKLITKSWDVSKGRNFKAFFLQRLLSGEGNDRRQTDY